MTASRQPVPASSTQKAQPDGSQEKKRRGCRRARRRSWPSVRKRHTKRNNATSLVTMCREVSTRLAVDSGSNATEKTQRVPAAMCRGSRWDAEVNASVDKSQPSFSGVAAVSKKKPRKKCGRPAAVPRRWERPGCRSPEASVTHWVGGAGGQAKGVGMRRDSNVCRIPPSGSGWRPY